MIEGPDQIGVSGSPSTSREITADLLEDAAETDLLGRLVYVVHPLGERYAIGIGTITEIRTSNRWHEDPNMRGVVKRRGALPHLSGEGDVRTAEITIQAVYTAENSNPAWGAPPTESGGAFGMSPATGSNISLATDGFLADLLRKHKGEIMYLGKVYRSNVRLPLTLRHFGSPDKGGAGEAYHSGVFGMTGSGKSALAAYMISAYLLHSDMGILIIDPQGQFTHEEGLPFSLQEWAKQVGREIQTYSISGDLSLPKDPALLTELLDRTPFFQDTLSIKGTANRESAAREFQQIIAATDGWENRSAGDLLQAALQNLLRDSHAMTRIYASKPSRDRLARMISSVLSRASEDGNQWKRALNEFRPIHSMFTPQNLDGEPRKPIREIILDTLRRSGPRPLVIIDLSSRGNPEYRRIDTEALKARLLSGICRTLTWWAEDEFGKGPPLNLLVVFDEAHRFASGFRDEEDEIRELADRLTDYVRTTRKFGLGWMFITQEINSLRRSIYQQLRIRAYGYGLTSGTELQRLRESVGDPSALNLYRSFVDPAAIRPPEYPFMLTGPVSPLSFTGTPVFLSVYTCHKDFVRNNRSRIPTPPARRPPSRRSVRTDQQGLYPSEDVP